MCQRTWWMKHQRILSAIVLLAFGTVVDAADKVALLIGTETYTNRAFRHLQYAADDARGLGKSLSQHGFDVTVLACDATTASSEHLTRETVASQLTAALAACTSETVLIVSLSGHGVQFVDDPLLATGVYETYFCPTNADLADRATLLPLSQLFRQIGNCVAKQKLIVVDIHHQDMLTISGRAAWNQKLSGVTYHESRHCTPKGVGALFGCMNRQFVWEDEPLAGSLFLYYVRQYLDGNADAIYYDDRRVNVAGLARFVRHATNEYAFGNELSDNGQLPVLRGDRTNWTIGELPPITRKSFVNSVGMTMVPIPPGEFLMGSPVRELDRVVDEQQHRVRITQPFYMSTTEVTRKQWNALMDQKPWLENEKINPETDGYTAVNWVSWNEATSYCNRLSKAEGRLYRLPTEAEWEYACRARSATARHFGNDYIQMADYAWYDKNSRSDEGYDVQPVAQKRPNAWELYDMYGNVWEYCSDWYNSNYYVESPLDDPPGPMEGSYRMIRGACFVYQDHAIRTATRGSIEPNIRKSIIGFRVVTPALNNETD